MAELLLELFCEEIPARMQARAADDLKRLVCEGLDEKRLGNYFSEASSFVTPRRLALVIDDLPERQMASVEVRMGPRSDAPEQAIKGFKGKLPKGAKVKVRETTKGTFLFASIPKSAQPTPEVLPEIVEAALAKLPWQKSMRWGTTTFRWVRPLHNILAILDGQVVNLDFDLVRTVDSVLRPSPETRLTANNVTSGHRFLAPDAFTVKDFADYRDRLRDAYVMLDAAERRRVIEQDAALKAEAAGLTLRPDAGLVAENAGMVEWPVVLSGRIDPAFMDLPAEVLTTVMRHHLKHFALLDADGKLAPRFLVVANIQAGDGGKQIVAGNERVLRARLADAKFFWGHDRKRTLESRVADLDGVVFHARLGSLGDKARRMAALAAEIAKHVPDTDPKRAERAALLAKADLTTDMVGEFPELQGIMGRYYALNDGETTGVADAIAEHYAPQGPDDACPSAPVSVCAALADKIDTLVGFWAIDEKPTGSKDPYALRRAALGVIRIVTENGLRLPLGTIHFHAYRTLNQQGYGRDYSDRIMKERFGRVGVVPQEAYQMPELVEFFHEEFLAFFADRLKVQMRGRGVRHDLIEAVFATPKPGGGTEDDLVRLLARVEALTQFLASDDGEHLLTAYRRAANIVRIEQRKDKRTYNGEGVKSELLREADEKAVAATLSEVSERSNAALADEKFGEAMAALATLRQPVDSFFDNVTVNCDDAALRENRLQLLSRIQWTMDHIADFSRIEG